MKAVFVGGSRRLSRLSAEVRHRLGSIMEGGFWVYVGDANGADKALQQFFAEHEYDRVLVYCVDGRDRNNLGRWQIRPVEPPVGARGFEYYAAKDVQMAADASFGMMLWDGVSRGTLANIQNLLARGKPVAVYCSRQGRFRDLAREADLADLLAQPQHPRTQKTGTGSAQQQLSFRTARGNKGRGL